MHSQSTEFGHRAVDQSVSVGQSEWAAIESDAMTNLLMVCMGNICRSPMAQTVAEHMAAAAMLSQQLKFDSAGTHTHRLGERPDPRVELSLSRRGYKLGRIRSRKITPHDFVHFDMILAMDAHNLAELRRLSPPDHLGKLRLFLDFAESVNETEVPDPYYGDAAGFERVLDLCEAAARGLIKNWT